MSKLVWDEVGKRLYETGVSKGVLYPQSNGTYPKGVAWSGLTAVNEAPEGAEANPMYADNIKYLNILSAEEFKATIEAYTYPDEFKPCIGAEELVEGVSLGQQDHVPFGFSYQTIIGNDTENNSHGYKIHVVYGCLAAPSAADYQSVNDSPEAATMSWKISTTPVSVADLSLQQLWCSIPPNLAKRRWLPLRKFCMVTQTLKHVFRYRMK